jgi:predicted AlkP superfamily pyrophosphatase or phosphodiesterase
VSLHPFRSAFLVSLLVLISCSRASVRSEEATPRFPGAHAKMLMSSYPGAVSRNDEAAQARPYVVLVSIDGYRWDFNTLFNPSELSRMQKEGASADSLIPVYPSKTFPNHYSIATGSHANRHGIVSNEFFDPAKNAVFSLPDRKAVEDGSWYGAEPLWNTARKQGLVTASFFFVGSEAEIGGMRPNYYFRYDDTVPAEARVDQVLNWLEMPPETRPHLITLYFGEVDMAAHRNGLKSPAVIESVKMIDQAIGHLREGLAKTGLPVNLILVSDHGLLDVDEDKTIVLDESAEAQNLLSKFTTQGRGPQMLLYLKPGENRSVIEETRKVLNRKIKNARVLSARDLKRLHYDGNPRTGDLVIDPDPDYLVGFRGSMPKTKGANHGWDATRSKSMHGIFFASGPAFKSATQVKSFENVNVYPLVLDILGLKVTTPIDGKLAPTQGLLKSRTASK